MPYTMNIHDCSTISLLADSSEGREAVSISSEGPYLAQSDEDIRLFNTAKWRLARRLCFLWSRPAICQLINGPVYPLLCLAIGLQFVGLCTKPGGS